MPVSTKIHLARLYSHWYPKRKIPLTYHIGKYWPPVLSPVCSTWPPKAYLSYPIQAYFCYHIVLEVVVVWKSILGLPVPGKALHPLVLDPNLSMGFNIHFVGLYLRQEPGMLHLSLSILWAAIGRALDQLAVSPWTMNQSVILKSSFIISVTITSSFWSGKVLNINKESRKIEHSV